ncbi:MAG: kumamolisin, partial [Thermoanaerobaculia bacterium]|nr:kumamolisin [Thermoanaerobaculia bacterium]
MATKIRRALVAGSEKPPVPPQAQVAGTVDSSERIEVTLLLRRPVSAAAAAILKTAEKIGRQLPEKRRYLSHAQFRERLGASTDDIAKIDAFASAHNLTIVETNIPARTVKVSGTIADITSAFETGKLALYKQEGTLFRGRSGTLSVPPELAGIVIGVFGIDNRPAVKRRGTTTTAPARKKPASLNTKVKIPTRGTTFSVPQVASLYNFPTGLDGTGQCIAIIEINDVQNGKATGGGFLTSDLQAYFTSLNLPMPQVSVIGVDGGGNLPGPAPGFDTEVTLDIEVAGAIAPGAQLAVYFGPNTTQGFLAAVQAALHDEVRKPSVISISWGSPEDAQYTDPQLVNGLNDALQDAAQLGITVCVATGDNGSADLIPPEMGPNPQPHVDAPSCSPFALACGGTKLTVNGNVITNEVVWNDGAMSSTPGSTGGGVSNLFARPTWQSSLTIPNSPTGNVGRGVPDVSGHAATSAGYQIYLKGKWTAIGGTSAVAPLYAGLIARINQQLATLNKPAAGFI